MKTNLLLLALLTFSLFSYAQDDHGDELDSRTFDRIEQESDYDMEDTYQYKIKRRKTRSMKLIKADLKKANTTFKNKRSIVKSIKSLKKEEEVDLKKHLQAQQ